MQTFTLTKNNSVRIPLSKEDVEDIQGRQNNPNNKKGETVENMEGLPSCFKNLHHYIYGCNPTINTVGSNYPRIDNNHPGIDHRPYLTAQLSNTSINTDLLIDFGAERSILTKETIDTINNGKSEPIKVKS